MSVFYIARIAHDARIFGTGELAEAWIRAKAEELDAEICNTYIYAEHRFGYYAEGAGEPSTYLFGMVYPLGFSRALRKGGLHVAAAAQWLAGLAGPLPVFDDTEDAK